MKERGQAALPDFQRLSMTNSLQRNRERGKGQRILSPLDPALALEFSVPVW